MNDPRQLKKKMKRTLIMRKIVMIGSWALLGILWPKLMGPQVFSSIKYFF